MSIIVNTKFVTPSFAKFKENKQNWLCQYTVKASMLKPVLKKIGL